MPPQPPKTITSFFNKIPTLSKAVPAPTSPESIKATLSTSTAAPSSPLTNIGSSPIAKVAGVKRVHLSDAARKAIEEGVAEGNEAKKAKLNDDAPKSSPVKVASIFTSAQAGPSTKTPKLPRATTKAELIKNLSSNARTLELLKMELETLGEDWLLALQDELTKPYFLKLKEFLEKERKSAQIFPPEKEVYSWSTLCPLKDVRVVIIGQDPYHDDGQAHGLAFSVRKGIRVPPSLRNIYKQMKDDIPGFEIPKHGDLTQWAKHGVLLLNTSLTVKAHQAASHSNAGWQNFTMAALKLVVSRLSPTSINPDDHVPGAKGVVFMAWGAHAQKACATIDKTKHLVLTSVHPSPLSAMRGFIGNEHFKKANEWLETKYGQGGGIDWNSINKE